MLTGGCKKCSKLCYTGIDSYMLDGDTIIDDSYYPTNPNILCYTCYNNYYSKKAIRDKKIQKLLIIPYHKRLLNKIKNLFLKYFKYIGIIKLE